MSKIYAYLASTGDTFYVRDGAMVLVAFEYTDQIEMGMNAAGADVVSLERTVPEIEEGLNMHEVTDDVNAVIAERIVSYANIADL